MKINVNYLQVIYNNVQERIIVKIEDVQMFQVLQVIQIVLIIYLHVDLMVLYV